VTKPKPFWMQQSEMKRKQCLIPFTDEEWHLWDQNCEEEYVVPLIKKYLRTGEQREMLSDVDYSIEDCLNGRVEGEAQQAFVNAMFAEWNAKLGYKHFNV